ncbi:glycosyltransferase [Chloroflexota bacterium]
MINETVVLLSPFEDQSEHRLSKHIADYLRSNTSFDRYLYQPLKNIFVKVIVFDYLKQMTEVGVKGVNEKLIELVVTEHPKYVLWLRTYYEIQESTFLEIKRQGSTIIGWFGDDEVCFDDYSRWRIPFVDYCVTGDIHSVSKYKELGAKVIHAIPCTGTAFDRDWAKMETDYDVSFVGVRDDDRVRYIDELRNHNINVNVFGSGWGRFLNYEDMINVFQTSKINLSFSKDRRNTTLQIKGKIFEVCMAGGFLLTEYNPIFEDYFDIEKEIVCFQDAEEMKEKIDYYLLHDKERNAIAQAGWKRATAEYTSFHMISKIFNEVRADKEVSGDLDKTINRDVKVPKHIRKRLSNYYLNWGNAFAQENYAGLWKDAFALSISYNKRNILALIYFVVGFLPLFIRKLLLKLYGIFSP